MTLLARQFNHQPINPAVNKGRRSRKPFSLKTFNSALITQSNMCNLENIRVLIADDHPVVRSGLAMILQYVSGIETIAEASTGAEAVQLFCQHQPDVVLMDLKMPEMGGVEAIEGILQACPNAHIIVLTTNDGDEDIYRGLQAGARGYLLKSVSREELIDAIHQVHVGRKYIPAEVGVRLAERMRSPQLTERERQVLMLMCEGKSNQEIALVLHVSEGTIKFHVNGILRKLDVSDRTQAVLVAIKRGIANL
ncbi:MAG: response regulator transcription factor [Leptolyngbyaceae bacterium]|nr:response regulator transcription factor [Leptolyngbyaceae bacterium]